MPKRFAEIELRHDLPDGTLLLCTPEVPVLLPSTDPRTNHLLPGPGRLAIIDTRRGNTRAVAQIETLHDLHMEVGTWLRALAGGVAPDAPLPQPLAPWAPILAGAAFAWGEIPTLDDGDSGSPWGGDASGRILTFERDPATWRLAGWLNQWWRSTYQGTELVWESGMTRESLSAWTRAAGPLHEQRELLARVLGAVHPRALGRALDALTEHEQSPHLTEVLVALEEEHLVSAGSFHWSDTLLDAPGDTLEAMVAGDAPTFGQMLAHARAHHAPPVDASARPIGAHAARSAGQWIRGHAEILDAMGLLPLAQQAAVICERRLARRPSAP